VKEAETFRLEGRTFRVVSSHKDHELAKRRRRKLEREGTKGVRISITQRASGRGGFPSLWWEYRVGVPLE
jgi:hypothetical protein